MAELSDADAELVADLKSRFEGHFQDPVHSQPVEKGEYLWTVTRWSTEDGVTHLFGDLEPQVYEALVDTLNDESPYWVYLEELGAPDM